MDFMATHPDINTYGDMFTPGGQTVHPAHAPGLVAMNAVAALASNSSRAWDFIDALWATPIPSGDNIDSDRYYSGLLYLEALLHLSGNYRAWL
jgi:oligosaccharide reducing-end xylanase